VGIRPLPRQVNWIERDGKTIKKATVTKEAWVVEEFPWGDFYKVLQEIRSEKGDKFLRFGYYVKDYNAPEKEYGWGGQTSMAIKKGSLTRLLQRAKKQRIL
jgi:outer membrane usher protein FimD/PapC